MASKRKTTTRAGLGIPNAPKSAAKAILPAKLPRSRVRAPQIDAGAAEPYTPPDEHNVSMRKISNGHIIREHGYEGGKRFENESFSQTKPKLQFETAKREARLAGKTI